MHLNWIRSLVQRGPFAPDAPPGRWTLGRLAPFVLVAWLALDVGLRLLPAHRFGVSPFAAAARHPSRHAPFRPGIRIESVGEVVGQGALTGNVEPTELRPPLTFSTNRFGYRRNPESRRGQPPDVLVLWGDSFIYGANLSDEETFPAALTRESGLAALNLGRPSDHPLRLKDVDWILRKFPERPERAVLVHLEHHNREVPADTAGWLATLSAAHPALGGLQRWRATEQRLRDNLDFVQLRAAAWWEVSPLQSATRRLFRAVSDDELLPNEYRQDVHEFRTLAGQPMIFRRYELFPAERPRSPSTLRQTAGFLTWWRNELAVRGMETVVLLIPTRYTLYGPWIEGDSAQRDVARAAADLYRLEAELNRRGIRTVNALTVFRQTAEEELRSGRAMSFFREDTHWTPLGVQRIADVLADSLAALGADATRERDLTLRPARRGADRQAAGGARALQ